MDHICLRWEELFRSTSVSPLLWCLRSLSSSSTSSQIASRTRRLKVKCDCGCVVGPHLTKTAEVLMADSIVNYEVVHCLSQVVTYFEAVFQQLIPPEKHLNLLLTMQGFGNIFLCELLKYVIMCREEIQYRDRLKCWYVVA